MTPEEWQRIENLCLAALEQQSVDRSEFLSAACGGDKELRHQVERLLTSYLQTGSFLEASLRSEALHVIAQQLRSEESRSSFLPGDVLLNRYNVLRSLGRGGMGEVYAVSDLELGRQVALKTIRMGGDYAQALYRFKREFRSLTDLQHPNLLKLYDLVSDGQTWFFTMELVDGVNFLQYVRPEGNLDQARLRQALSQLTQAVEALHRAGKLHLDIKPSNVMVTSTGSVRLIDFGLVTELLPEDVTQTASFLGTPAYMAPEQYGGDASLSEASDWYSIGIMVYEALTGKVPFSGSPFEIYRKKLEQSPVAPCALVPDIPGDLSALCIQLLERKSAARPSGTDILRWALKEPEIRPDQQGRNESRESPFVGREVELQILGQAYLDSRFGHPVVVSITGASGIGKTAIARHFLQSLERHRGNAVLLTGRCYERESVPFKAIDSLLDSLMRHLSGLPAVNVAAVLPRDTDALVRLFPVLQQVQSVAKAPEPVAIVDVQGARRRAFAALKELLARLADRSPLVIFIDDMQWSDADSFALLDEVIGSEGAPSALVIFTHRSGDADASKHLESLLWLVASKGAVHNLRVAELSREDSLNLTTHLLGPEPVQESVLEKITRESEGIPFFIDQLARFYRQSGENMRPELKAEVLNLSMFVAARIAALPAPACSLLEIIALAGQPLRLDQLKGAAGFDIHDDAALPMLRAEKLIKTKQKRNRLEIEMYHDRIREVVADRIAPAARQQHHLALAVSLEKCGDADPESLAHHFEQAEVFDKAASYAESAAERAATALAFDQAARLYTRALRISPQPAPKRRKLRIGLAEALANAGRGLDSAEQYLQAANETSGTEALQLRQRGAEQFLRCGYLDEGFTLLQQISVALGLRLATGRMLLPSLLLRRLQLRLRRFRYREREAQMVPPEELLRIDVCWSLAAGWTFIDSLRGAEAQALHLALALRCGEPGRIALGLAAEAGYATVRGKRSLRGAPRLLGIAKEVATRSGNAHALGLATFSAGMEAWMHGNFPQALESYRSAEEIYVSRCKGVVWERETAQIFGLACLAWMGHLTELSRILPPLRQEAQRRGDRYAAASLLLLTRGWLLHLADDNPDLAQHEITSAMEQWPSDGYHLQHFWALLGKFEVALYRGQPERAAELASEQWSGLRRSLLLSNPAARFFAAHLHACSSLAAAMVAQAARSSCSHLLRAAAKDIHTMRAQRMLSSYAMADLMSAGAALIGGELGEAVRLYGSAEKGFESAHMQLYSVVAQRRRGELIGGDEGRLLITAADIRMQSQGVRNPARVAATLAPGV